MRQWSRVLPGVILGNMIRGALYRLRLRRAGVHVFWSHMATEAHGEQRVETLDIAPLGVDGRLDLDKRQRLIADVVCLGYGFIASTEIARCARLRDAMGRAPSRKPRSSTSRRLARPASTAFSLWATVQQVAGAAAAMAEGALAGSDRRRASWAFVAQKPMPPTQNVGWKRRSVFSELSGLYFEHRLSRSIISLIRRSSVVARH